MSMYRKMLIKHEQWSILKKFRGIFGNSDSEIVKYVVMSYLSEKTFVKQEIEKK